MIWTLVLDGLVAVLLVVAIVLATILNRRFAGLDRDRLEFANLAQEFNAALGKAESSVACLKTTAAALEAENKRAEAHEEDLRQLIDRAEAACDRLEASLRAGRPQSHGFAGPARAGADPVVRQLTKPVAVAAPRSEAERDLLQALQFKR
ncbi:MAG: DUF6468 domain-containing protein [Rhodospirillales bacterium]|nr:DUF6468 domain-containing protein [Rhodospirillales bacterium]